MAKSHPSRAAAAPALPMTKNWVAPVVLAGVALTHYGYDIPASYFDNVGYAARNIFYALRGLEGALFAIVIGLLARRADVSAVCLWAVYEESQTTICRIAKGIGAPNQAYEQFAGLCGKPSYLLGLVFAGLIALGLLYELGRHRGQKRS